ncbi:hypothetical protein ABDJ41_07970 [Pedobacter sp. ASV1-7]|uniref:hypothetical protein n=1 Tax=Pedobacter sp. ASV1-7 TaxID=3145237 RepID=UPI0032E90D97
MDFKDQIAQLAARVEKMIPQIQTEEATKNALVMPFIQIMGYVDNATTLIRYHNFYSKKKLQLRSLFSANHALARTPYKL